MPRSPLFSVRGTYGREDSRDTCILFLRMRVKSEVGSPHNACISTSIYYHVSYDRHLPRAHAYDLNSKAARGVYIERTSDVEVQRSQRSTWRSVATWTPSREEKQG